MSQDNRNWIPVAGSALGVLIGGIPGALIGGLIGAIIKEFTCPICKGRLKDMGAYYQCQNCKYIVMKNQNG